MRLTWLGFWEAICACAGHLARPCQHAGAFASLEYVMSHTAHTAHPALLYCLQYEYPDQYEAEDAAPVGDDANLLAQPEVEPSPATRLRSGRSKGRGFVSVKA